MDHLAGQLGTLDQALGKLSAPSFGAASWRWRADAAALLFHLRNRHDHPPLVAMLGGTGTGKSTIVNRLIDANVSATSLRRTFTSGAVAIAGDVTAIPGEWLGIPRQVAQGDAIPARGQTGSLIVVPLNGPLSQRITLIDTPDLDGDQPQHQAEADRVFRWAEALIFLVTPEKYQMTELLPYYRLARRYALPALFVMNKCEEPAVLEDFRQQLAQREWPDAGVFVVPRDDAAYEPPPEADLPTLRAILMELSGLLADPHHAEAQAKAMQVRLRDLIGRLHDQIIAPMRDQRREIDRLVVTLRAMTTPTTGVDVGPITRQLQRRLQEQSVLYLMGPQRMLDRVRQVPGMLARLPRTAWDVLVRGQTISVDASRRSSEQPPVPDFPKLLADQLTIVQSRIDDVIRANPVGQSWITAAGDAYAQAKFPPSAAAKIAEEELAALKAWLEQRWHATPRDTAILLKLLKLLPGGKQLTKWTEAAPYLLAIVVATHHAFFGPIDLAIIGSFTLATWLGEKLSNEVTARTRQANRQIAERFAKLAQEQVDRMCGFLEQQAPAPEELRKLERMAEELMGSLQEAS